jgi:hypothetical protein
MAVNGLQVLVEGLREMPTPLTASSVVPLDYWKSSHFGTVLFLRYSLPHNEPATPAVTRGVFRREGENWKPLKHWAGSGWSHDSISNPGSITDLGGRAIYDSGGSFIDQPSSEAPAIVIAGRHSPDVKEISVIKSGLRITVPANGHFGAWIVCLDEWVPYTIEASDENGAVIGLIPGPHRLPSRETAK